MSARRSGARRIEAAGRAFEERSRTTEDGRRNAESEWRNAGEVEGIRPPPSVLRPPDDCPPFAPPAETPFGPDRRPGQCRAIIEEVAAKYDVPVKDILSDRRAKVLIPPRHEAMYRCVAETPLSLPAIGRVFHRDHTSIGHGVMRHHLRTGDPLPRGMDWQAGRRKRR